MKASPEMDPAAAFPDARHRPGDRDLPGALGDAFAPYGELVSCLHDRHPEITTAWQYSARVGWYQVQLLKKRRLLYLVPKHGDFRLAIILGGKALTALNAEPFAAQVNRLRRNARHYTEGTLFNFDRTSLDPAHLAAFLEAKLSPEVCRKSNTARPASPSRTNP